MRLLVLGGSIFVGRHIVEAALERGHEVTVFSRGKHGPELFPDIERLRGDRRSDLSVLDGRSWDAMVDTCGYRPEVVRRSSRFLSERVGHCVFISSASVYPDHSITGLTEDGPLKPTWDPAASPDDPDAYGPLKAACEQEVHTVFRDRSLVVRPGLMVGPYDPTNRFGYWPVRWARGGSVLVPGPSDRPIQMIDARDHARFLLEMSERSACGTFNATSPAGALTMRDVVTACRVSGCPAKAVWVESALLEEHRVRPWTELPLWGGSDPTRAGTMQIATDRAQAQGLHCRPLAETAADVLAWEATRGPLAPRGGQMVELRERLLLAIAEDELRIERMS